jgi:hypothetical protein
MASWIAQRTSHNFHVTATQSTRWYIMLLPAKPGDIKAMTLSATLARLLYVHDSSDVGERVSHTGPTTAAGGIHAAEQPNHQAFIDESAGATTALLKSVSGTLAPMNTADL